MVRCILVAVAAALVAGCADFGAPIGGGGGGTRALPPEEARLQQLEQRVADVSRKVDNLTLAAQNQDLRRLETDLRTLRGDVESLQNALQQLDKRNQALYSDLDRRITRLEAQSRPSPLSMAPSLAEPPPVPATQEEESSYLRTFEQLKAARYDDAIAGFREQVARWPQGKYADNAWYWLGEAYFIKHDYRAAQDSFQSLMSGFPQSPKVPDAMYRQIEMYVELKQVDSAKGAYDRLMKNFPNSSAAGKARQKFDKLD